MRLLVTGADGFIGGYVSNLAESAGYEVCRAGHTSSSSSAIDLILDLLDPAGIEAALNAFKPNVILHLAGSSFVANENRAELYSVNLLGTVNLLDGVEKAGLELDKFIPFSSAAIYGNQGVEVLSESLYPAPNTDYGISKLAMELATKQVQSRIPSTIIRLFNTTGIGHSTRFVIPKIVDHFKRRASEIELGNIDTLREYNDVRDIAEILIRLVDSDRHNVTVNVCSGRGTSIREVIQALTEITGHQIEVLQNPAFVRKNEIERLVGSPELLREQIGPVQFRDVKHTLRWMVEAGQASTT